MSKAALFATNSTPTGAGANRKSRMKTTADYPADSRSGSGTEPGAVDNRLSLDPNDKRWAKILAAWEDGETYKVTLEINQMSPGEFEVNSVEEEGGEAEPDEGSDTEETSDTGGAKVNKSVKKMMDEEMA